MEGIKLEEKGSHLKMYKEYVKAVIPGLIKHLEKTNDDEWITGVTTDKDAKKRCIIVHIVEYFNILASHKKLDEYGMMSFGELKEITNMTDKFLFDVNDGKIDMFNISDHPRVRCIYFFEKMVQHSLSILPFIIGYHAAIDVIQGELKEKNTSLREILKE